MGSIYMFKDVPLVVFMRNVGPTIQDILQDRNQMRREEEAKRLFLSVKIYLESMSSSGLIRGRSIFSTIHDILLSVSEREILGNVDNLYDFLNSLKDFFDIVNAEGSSEDLDSPRSKLALNRMQKYSNDKLRKRKNAVALSTNIFGDMPINQFVTAAKAVTDVLSTSSSSRQVEAAKSAVVSMQTYLDSSNTRKPFRADSAMFVLKSALNKIGGDVPVLTPDRAIEYIDYIHDFLDAIEVEEDEQEDTFEVSPNMSANLLRVFGKQEGYEFRQIPTNWQAPKTHGLHNSKPIVKYNPGELPFGAKESGTSASSSHTTSTNLVGSSFYSAPKVPSRAHHATHQAKNGRDDDEEDDALDEDDEEDNHDENDDEEEQDEEYDDDRLFKNPNIMSAKLRNALGLHEGEPVVTDWVPPAFSGLMNSARIIGPTLTDHSKHHHRSNHAAPSSSSSTSSNHEANQHSVAEDKAVAKSQAQTQSRVPVTSSNSTSSSVPGAKSTGYARIGDIVNQNKSKAAQSKNDNDEEEDEDDEDDNEDGSDYDEEDEDDEDDDDDDDDDIAEKIMSSGAGMSASLRRALGLDVEEEADTDWKPPEFAGVTNSSRLI